MANAYYTLHNKFRRLGPTNQIVDNLDTKASEFKPQNLSDLSLTIKIGSLLKDDVNLRMILTNF